jgi:predicted DNA-binding transcriptional regulator YafY
MLRQWHMLRRLPRFPSKITAGELTEYLAREGFEVSKRSVERDLLELQAAFLFEYDARARPYGWYWPREVVSLQLPGLSLTEAIAFTLTQQQLAPLLPASSLKQLGPYFDAAKKALREHARGAAWSSKVRVVSANQALLPPNIDAHVQQTVSEALFRDQQLLLRYRRRAHTEATQEIVNPLALVQRGAVLYLVCTFADRPDPRMLVLHRMVAAQMLDEPARRPKGFNVDAYIASGAFGFGTGKSLKLEAVFERNAGQHLLHTPLAADQRIKVLSDSALQIKATVHDNPQLRWWLLAFGDQIEIKKPASLREEVHKIAQNMMRRHA